MNRDVLRHVYRTYGHSGEQRLGYALTLVNILFNRIFVIVIVARVVSDVASGNLTAAKHGTLLYFATYAVGSMFGVVAELLCLDAENKQYGALTKKFHNRLINKDMAFFRDNQTGYLTSVFRQHLDNTMLIVRYLRGEAMAVVVALVVPAVIMLVANLAVGLIAVAVVVVQVVYIFWSSAKAAPHRESSNEIYRKMTAEVADEMTNIVAFKSAGVEDQAQHRISDMAEQEVDVFWARRKLTSMLDFPRNIITAAGTTAAIYVIVNGATANDPKSLGLIVLTLTYMFQILRSVAALPSLIETYDDYVARLYPTLKYLGDSYEIIRDPAKPKKLVISKASITLDDIDFSYPTASADKRIEVFNKLRIVIEGGEQVGIVGLSGAGKSTLANLLLRFDDVTGGAILIDGIDIRDIKQTDLRANIGYVPQEPLLFHRTVRENIAYYDETASNKAVARAAKAAHAAEFIEKLPEGYDTVVGERGVKLSGGQKQRVAIARAVLKNAPIMIFDEATSALDSESEEIIQRALPEILGKQTAIIVAHRLSTVAGLDRILVMHDGKVAEEGTHAQLLELKGRYYGLWQKQTRSQKTS